MFYHVGGSRHTQNIQISQVIGENKNMSFILRKSPYRLFGQPNKCKNHFLAFPSEMETNEEPLQGAHVAMELLCLLHFVLGTRGLPGLPHHVVSTPGS